MTGSGAAVPTETASRPRAFFDDVFVEQRSRGRRWWASAGVQLSAVAHALLLGAIVLVPIFLPSELPSRPDVLVSLIYDPPPPPPPPLLRGSAFRLAPVKPEPPKPTVEQPSPRDFVAPIQVPQPQEKPKLQPEPGVRPQDQLGSETGSDLGDPAGMEGGVVGGVVGGTLGGVPGGVIGGTGTGPVLDYDAPPTPVKITPPQYPHEAFIKKIEGEVVLEILIDSSGHVVGARVIRSNPLLDEAAVKTVYQWLFRPAVKNGRPVATLAHAPVTFRLF